MSRSLLNRGGRWVLDMRINALGKVRTEMMRGRTICELNDLINQPA